jgi:hypothetical protein
MATARKAAANRKKGAGPESRTTSAASATETGKTPKLVSASRPLSRPSRFGGAHCWKAVIVMTLPKPFMIPRLAIAAATATVLPR